MKSGILLVAFMCGCFATVSMTSTANKKDNREIPEYSMMEIKSEDFGQTSAGEKVTLFTCTNANGYVLKMIDYGATVVSFEMPDRLGNFSNVNLGCANIEGYEAQSSYFGCTVGRYCNRIAGGQFKIGEETFSLAKNNGENHLHGGAKGWNKAIWKGQLFRDANSVGIRFTHNSPDGDEGYPGNVDVTVDYMLTNNNELIVEFQANTDKPTHINLTNHNYWNLGGTDSGEILDHQLQLASSKYIPVDPSGIPTGELADVESTPFDFRTMQTIGDRVNDIGGDPIGYDHCYVLDAVAGQTKLAAVVKDPKSGRVMEVHTTQPGIQFYTGNFMDGTESSGGFAQHCGFCLETQHFPDAPNQADFKSTLLDPERTYHQITVHRFYVERN